MTRFIAIDRRKYDTSKMRIVLIIASVWTLLSAPATASAFDLEEALRQQHTQYERPAELLVAQQGGKTLGQAIAEVRRRTGGKVVGAETRQQGNCEVHRIKVLTEDGRVQTHTVRGRCR